MLHPTAPRECQNGFQGGIGKNRPDPLPNEARLTKIEYLPPRTTCARVLRPANPKKNDNPQKDNQNMAAKTSRQSASEIHAIAGASRPPASTKNRVAPRPSPLAQIHPRRHCREPCSRPNPKTSRFPTAPLAQAHPRPTALPGNFRSRGFRCRGVKLIYGSAIKTSHKGRRISKLQNSNRR
jgi:hypothetical protein